MTIMLKLVTAMLLIISLLIPLVSTAEIISMPDSINKAGRQRMLTQRMVKAYIMMGVQIDYDKAKSQLADARNLFNQQLDELKAFAPTEKIKKGLNTVESIWGDVQRSLDQPHSREVAAYLLERNDDLLRASHKVVLMLQDLQGSTQGRLVNISGRQRMLSQRLTKLYMARLWQFSSAKIGDDMQRARIEFKGAMQELMQAEQNTDALNLALKKADQQWRLFESGLNREHIKIPLIIARNSENLLINMNKITGMYAGL